MPRITHHHLAAFSLAATLASLASAQTLTMSWSTIDFGAATLASPNVSLCATIGQHDAGPPLVGAAQYLSGGYWCGALGGACRADLDDGTGLGTPDGAVGIDDLIYFLVQFELGNATVDLDDGTGQGVPDGAVGIDDLVYFLVRFENGC